MPNPLHRKFPSAGPANPGRGSVPKIVEKAIAWPGLPGKTQPRSRSAGAPKVKIHPKSEGI